MMKQNRATENTDNNFFNTFFLKIKSWYSLEKQKKGRKVFFATIWSILIALLISSLVIASVGINPFEYFAKVIEKAFEKKWRLSMMISFLIITTLGVALCFKIGFFNLSVSSQILLSGILMLIITSKFSFSGASFALSIFIAIIISSLISILVAILKVYSKVNEVVSSIMLNWIILYLVIFILKNTPYIQASAFTGQNSISFNFPSFMHKDFWSYIVLSLSLLLAIAVWAFLKFTIIGYKISVIGNNKDAAKYATINENLFIISIMGVSGVFSGIAAFIFYLIQGSVEIGSQPLSEGFDTIAITLLANNNPLGVILSSSLFSILKVSSSPVADYYNFPDLSYFSQIVVGIIVYGAATMSLFYRFELFRRLKEFVIILINWKQYKSIRIKRNKDIKTFLISYKNSFKSKKELKNQNSATWKTINKNFSIKREEVNNSYLKESLENHNSRIVMLIKNLENLKSKKEISLKKYLKLKHQIYSETSKLKNHKKTSFMDVNQLSQESQINYFESMKALKTENDFALADANYFKLNEVKINAISVFSHTTLEFRNQRNKIINNYLFSLKAKKEMKNLTKGGDN